MFNPTLLTQIDALKARLDRIRPLAPDLVENLREVYNIRLTYHSDAIMVPELMQEFGDWLHSNPALHPVEIATETHYRLVTIHPFQDGNGRTARLLMNLSLLRFGYPIAVIKTEDRSAYIDAIVAWQSGGDNSALKETIAKCVESSLVEILSLAGEGV